MAKVILRICNYDVKHPTKSFKFDQYGRTIIVERTFRENGGSYAIKSHDEKTISTKKEELDAILSEFSIQIDNPICVLNQEVSRNFLNSKNPSDKYKFFMKATRLEDILASYQSAVDNNEHARVIYNQKEKHLPELKHEMEKYKKKLELFESCDQMRQQLTALKRQLAWKHVEEEESKVGELEQKIAQDVKKISNAEEHKKIAKKEIDKLQAEAEALQNNTQDTQRKLAAIQKRRDEAFAGVSSLRQERNNKQSNVKMEEARANRTKQEIAGVEKTIAAKQRQNE